MKPEPAPVVIRLAAADDAVKLLSLIRKAMAVYAQNSGIETPLDAEMETLDDMLAHLARNKVLVAEQDGKLIGTVRLVRQDRDTAWFTRFAVLPERQRLGIGQLLFQAAEEQLRQEGFVQVLLHTALTNLPLVTFYQTRGFILLDVHHTRGYPRGRFMKRLDAAASAGPDASSPARLACGDSVSPGGNHGENCPA